MPAPDFHLRSGDTASAINATLTDQDDVAVNIQGAAIIFSMQRVDGSGTILSAGASIVQNGDGTDGSAGKVRYSWPAGNSPGLYLAEWQVTYAGGTKQTFPNDRYVMVRVTEEIA